jgi:hypothetical protein
MRKVIKYTKYNMICLVKHVEEHCDEAFHVEYTNHKEDPHEDKTIVFAPLSNEDEVIQDSISPTHEEMNMVSYTLFQVFYVSSFHD